MSELNSVGKCIFCKEEFSKSEITRHLSTHLKQKSKGVSTGISYHIKAESAYNDSPYFLNLWVDGEMLMADIDGYLRAIWLECCGHMSAFTDPAQKKMRSMFDDFMEDRDELMESAAKDVLEKGLKLKYDYDFGSTTELSITVVNEWPLNAPEGIVLLSRNEPLEIMCELCHLEPAVSRCTVCYGGPNMFCKKCAKKHAKVCEDFAEYAALPVVNSPRMGVCAYDGGRIDKQRDGVFRKKAEEER